MLLKIFSKIFILFVICFLYICKPTFVECISLEIEPAWVLSLARDRAKESSLIPAWYYNSILGILTKYKLVVTTAYRSICESCSICETYGAWVLLSSFFPYLFSWNFDEETLVLCKNLDLVDR